MSPSISRRYFLATAATTATAVGAGLPRIAWAAQDPQPLRLAVEKRVLEVKGKAAPVFGIRHLDGTSGLFLDPGQRFIVDLANRSGEDTIIHWHGQTPPYIQDGVADKNRPLAAALP